MRRERRSTELSASQEPRRVDEALKRGPSEEFGKVLGSL